MMKIKRILLTAVFLLTTITSISVNASPQTPDNEKFAHANWEDRRAYLEKNFTEIGNDVEKFDTFMEQNGLEAAETMIPIQPQSAPGNVQLYNIKGYRDRFSGKYVVSGRWIWNNISNIDSNAGAVDGVSLALCQTNWNPVTGYVFTSQPAGIAVYDQDSTHYPSAGGVSSISKSGIAYTFQDSYKGALWWIKYCGYSGQVWFWLDRAPDQLPIYIKMDFTHTWSEAELDSAGIEWAAGSAPKISMKFKIAPKNFTLANQVTLSSWPSE